ncbi:MAG TPA: PEP/pyruvate-binding domain-containing protein, partial [Candidatus Paceibacterota bacterium]|nr:PEP/pyruvate-binding domain-containing protein [Candidatus Paceibacterota bacterium]
LDRYYQTLQAGGVTRERLQSFDRPIRSTPDFISHLKDRLIYDFQNFLKILKAVHAGTDLETAINTARDQLDGDTQGLLWNVWNHRNDSADGLVPLVEQITNARHRLSDRLNNARGLRELLYLDLALEQLVRVAVERNLHSHLTGDQLVNLIASVLENVALSYEDNELGTCMRHWEHLQQSPRFSAEWSLHAKSVTDRIGRALSGWIDRFYQLLQPKAEVLGRAFKADSWAIALFSEEVVRGSSLGFVLSMLLRQLDPILRKTAHLGAWQIVSRGSGTGKVQVVAELHSIQGKRLGTPTIVIAEKVSGDEEIPDDVAAVIAPDVTDLVSHVAVRARNAHLLFASCHDPGMIEQLKALAGHQLHLEVTAAGDVIFEETTRTSGVPHKAVRRVKRSVARPHFSRFAIAPPDFTERLVGAKSLNQARLRGKLPDWIHQPAAMAIPFGVFEKILSAPVNEEVSHRYGNLTRQLNMEGAKLLPELRETVLWLSAPDEFKAGLGETAIAAGLPLLENWDDAWPGIKRVWASKWNERAFLSRETMRLAHDDLFMAVLIQPVIEGDYAFVVHTANPSTGNRDELYGEVVLGLGETLVGNHPGRALSFTWNKKSGELKLLSYPSKSFGLYGGGLIFRSDSNGEDLAGFAG